MEIYWNYFIISVIITFIIVYFTRPEPKKIVKYPSADDQLSSLYIDDNDVCYKYHRKEIF
jgi:hypothetical protein